MIIIVIISFDRLNVYYSSNESSIMQTESRTGK